MKRILLIVLLTLPIVGFGQVKKKNPVKLSEIQVIKVQGLKWFKEVYVENNFKDPYSYKLLKADIYPVTYKESLEKIIRDADDEVNDLDTNKSYSDYYTKRQEYYKQFNNLKFYPHIYTQSDVDRAKKGWDEETIRYQKSLSNKKQSDSLMLVMDNVTAKKTQHYVLYIDCYSNNSYGNKVLGKFVFYYGKQGLVREPFQLND